MHIILINIEDDWYRGGRTYLLDYCCEERDDYDMTFTTAVDPYGDKTEKYFTQGYIPLNMVVDDEMVIRYKVEDYSLTGIRNIVEQLLSE